MTRKGHLKSRHGCLNCKRRRVKCGEEKPACSNCSRLRVACSFGTSGSPSTRDGPYLATGFAGNHEALGTSSGASPDVCIEREAHPARRLTALEHHTTSAELADIGSHAPPLRPLLATPTALFDVFDLELLHHFFTHVSQTFAEDGSSPIKWRENLSSTVFSSPISLHALLAVSALHLSRRDEHRLPLCEQKAAQHYERTLRPLTHALDHLSNDNANEIFVVASFLCYRHFALGPQPGRYLVFTEQGEAELVWLLRGVKAILKQVSPFSEASPPNPSEASVGEHTPRSIGTSLHSDRFQYREPLARLKAFVSILEAEERTMAKYSKALDTLTTCFEDISDRGLSLDDTHALIRGTMRWLYCLEDGYLEALRDKRPVALVILAHFAVVLHRVRQMWYMEGWSTHVLEGVKMHLDPRYTDWILWPIHQLGMGLQ